MKLIVKDVDIATGDVPVVILNQDDAACLDIHHNDRVLVKRNSHSIIAVVDIGESKKAVPRGHIGLFEEVLTAVKTKQGDTVTIALEKKPPSTTHIRNKLDGAELSKTQILEIVRDIVQNKLTDIELTSYVAANYTRGMSMREVIAMTHALKQTGAVLHTKAPVVADIHCIGGVPGNRTTMIVVPILAAAGLTIPKTSSRAITSPAGTADTMEVLCNVNLTIAQLERILHKHKGFIVWGGAVNLAPADDRIIKVEHPLSIDAEGQMLASIMAKKASVGATHLLMDIPYGAGAKIATYGEAQHFEHMFMNLGKHLHMEVSCMLTDGSQPIGNGIGPALEAKDCLWVLENSPEAPRDLKTKSLEMAAAMLEFSGRCKRGAGLHLANALLESGEAHRKMCDIIKAQGKKTDNPNNISVGKKTYTLVASRTGKLRSIDSSIITKIARLAGAPRTPSAGVYVHKHRNDTVRARDPLLTIYSEGDDSLAFAREFAKKNNAFLIK